ncbi:MAG TPA: hypothetical protein PLW88_01600 [Syntrophorhabdaceae bacterium]|nr:hypothetical protein [Syntrophorhabdaceae bacterium]HPP06036.1 hypothetical protein [Syntrophorhabdaceae bacterium]
MISTITDVITIEKEADSILENAHIEAKHIEREYGEKIQAYEEEKRLKLEESIALYKKKAEEEFKETLRGLEEEERSSLEAIDLIHNDIIERHAEAIVSKLFNF